MRKTSIANGSGRRNWSGWQAAARQAHELGLRVNAGHGLNYQNLAVLRQTPHLVELNIGHSIISRALVTGLATAVREMLLLMGESGE